MIEALEEKKEAAIERTCKMVAKYFVDVFKELTQQGSTLLIMQRASGEGTLPLTPYLCSTSVLMLTMLSR